MAPEQQKTDRPLAKVHAAARCVHHSGWGGGCVPTQMQRGGTTAEATARGFGVCVLGADGE